VPRGEFADAAHRLGALAPPDALVVAPLEIAAQANRRTPIHYPEIEGLVRMVARADREGTLGALTRRTRQEDFVALHQRAHDEWRGELELAIADGRVRAAIVDPTQTDTQLRALQTLELSADDLVRRGFKVAATVGRYTLLVH
jgi:hypothetical protein